MRILIFLLIVFISVTCKAQVNLNFQSTYLKDKWITDSLNSISKDSIQISLFKMYISNVELKNGNKVVFKEKNSFHLIDFSDTSTTSFLLTNKKVNFTSISFQVGVDSSTTLSGALGGDLDPTKGMYWTWQTGYIHFKLEGINNFKTKKDFVYHIGGFQNPNNTLRKIELKTIKSNDISIDFQLDQLIQEIEKMNIDQVMSPGNAANEISFIISRCFKICN
jgi:hypothetical protein